MANLSAIQGFVERLGDVNGQDIVNLIENTFGIYDIRPETKMVLQWNFKRIWGFSHEDWHKASETQKAFTITDGIILAPVRKNVLWLTCYSLLQGSS